MEEEAGKKYDVTEKEENNVKEEVFTKIVRAGKRTYFFDVKVTRSEDYYLTITESKKRLGREGKVFYEKHKIFLYKEDFDKFSEGLKEAVGYIDTVKDKVIRPETGSDKELVTEKHEFTAGEFTNVDFDDLGKK